MHEKTKGSRVLKFQERALAFPSSWLLCNSSGTCEKLHQKPPFRIHLRELVVSALPLAWIPERRLSAATCCG